MVKSEAHNNAPKNDLYDLQYTFSFSPVYSMHVLLSISWDLPFSEIITCITEYMLQRKSSENFGNILNFLVFQQIKVQVLTKVPNTRKSDYLHF